MNAIDGAFQLAQQNITTRKRNSLFWNLREAFVSKDVGGLTKELQYCFQSFIVRQRFSKSLQHSQTKLLDLRYPAEWFPATREIQRTVHIHVGPTNSGKTYHALEALQKAKSGIYAGPLRLLANEVYHRLLAKGVPCGLVTGEELRFPEDTDRYFTSCTVEMIPLNKKVDVAVIDEIQMIANPDRGSAWTSALLGVQAKEVHLCGEERTVKLLKDICAGIGDKVIVHRYERLSPLSTMDSPLNDFSNLRKGDCVVAFSRVDLYVLKRQIERQTNRRCAIVYGNLPPEVRVKQAALFNNPDNDYDFIVASDAIGMGLNLEIRRVIFDSISKFDGMYHRLLTRPEIKQIGGRAGRYRTARTAATNSDDETATNSAAQRVGYVTCLERADLDNIQQAFVQPVEDITRAILEPPSMLIEQFASYYHPDTPFSFILMRVKAASTLHPLYAMSINRSTMEIADVIQDIPLSVADRLTVCRTPASLRVAKSVEVLRALAKVISTHGDGNLLSIEEMPLEILDVSMEQFRGTTQDYLFALEALHTAVNQYVWLSFRFSSSFPSQTLAMHVKSLVEDRLAETLEHLDFTDAEVRTHRRNRRMHAKKNQRTFDVEAEKEADETAEHETDDVPIDDGLLDGEFEQEGWQQEATEADAGQRR